MAKKNKKKKNKSRKGLLGTLAATGIATEIIGNALGQVLADSVEKYTSEPGRKERGSQEAAQAVDVAAQLLTVLAERGPLTIPDLLTSTRAALTQLLRAIQDVQQFGLIEYLPDSQTVRLTDTGARTALAVKGIDIRQSAARMLEED